MMKKLGIIYPTCNRPASIEVLLSVMAAPCKKRDIEIIIYDSSNDDRTENVVQNYRFAKKTNVIYDRYTGKYDGFSIDTKVIDALKKYANRYEYLWIVRDGLVITIDKCYEDLEKIIDKRPDYIVVDSSFRYVQNHKSYREYREPVAFCRNHFQRMVTLGTTIFRNDVVRKLVEKYPLNNTNYSLWTCVVPFWDVAYRDFLTCSYIGDVFFYNPAGTTNSFWNKSGHAMEQWVFYYTRLISKLPEVYGDLREELYRLDLYDFHPFRLNSMLKMRGNGGLTWNIVREYRHLLPLVSSHKVIIYYVLSCVPKCIARYIVDHQYTCFWRNVIQFYRLACLDVER